MNTDAEPASSVNSRSCAIRSDRIVLGTSDSTEFRELADRIMRRHAGTIVDAVAEVGELGLVESAYAGIRVYPAVPMFFKLYAINNSEAFFGRDHAASRWSSS